MRSNASRWPIPIIAFVLAMPLLTGCAVDKGTALAADFEEDWVGASDVEKVSTLGDNTLPFMGKAIGVLVLKDDTPPDRVAERANELSEYVARNDSITGRITADGITVTVDADKRRAGEVVALWRSLATDERVVDGDISGSSSKKGHRWLSKVTAVDSAGALGFDDMADSGGRHRPLSDVTSVEVRTGRDVRPGLLVQSDVDGGLPTEAIAAYEAVVAEHPVVGASLQSARVGITLADAADRDDAPELARRAAPGLDAAAVSVTGEGGA
ncbi:hypothetical protein [Streptomyces sp. NBC_00887]|uniref:hypothetical protein n=1 Tax=Streptomyces sp. NBC_00887 TaxID=2975859 RepID=UPI00386CDED8|nr:hypothetical protein OG844_02975 [Streptomyces sp. NBC_00887]WSY35922.1 hypothetical protein OG844_42625 [Streptomyces sp. NBC_00887]